MSYSEDFAVIHNALGTLALYADEPHIRDEMMRAFAALRSLEQLETELAAGDVQGASARSSTEQSPSNSVRDRCGNTVHSEHVTDHRCLRDRGHPGDCLFGAGNAVLLDIINELVSERESASDPDYSPSYQDEYQRLWHQAASERDELKEQLEAAHTALAFYAEPETYFAISFLPDPPCGEFEDDFEELDGALGHPDGGSWTKPGKRARDYFRKFYRSKNEHPHGKPPILDAEGNCAICGEQVEQT